MSDKKKQGAPRKNDTRDMLSLRIRRSVITKLEAIGETEGISGRSIASEIVEATINRTKSPLANLLLLSTEALSILQHKAAIADCPVETLVEAAICALDVSHFEQLHREAEQGREKLAQSLAAAKNSLTMLNREVVATHPQAPIPAPVFRDFDTVSREMSAGIDTSGTPNPFVNPNAPTAPVAPKLPTLADAYARLNRSSAAARSEAPKPVEAPTNTHFCPVATPVELEPAPRHPDQGPLDPERQADLDFSNRYRATIGLPPSTWLEYLNGNADPYGPLPSAAPIPSVNFDFRPKTGFAGGN